MDRHTDAQYRLTDIEKQRYRYTRRGRVRKTQSDTHTHKQRKTGSQTAIWEKSVLREFIIFVEDYLLLAILISF